MSGVPPCRCCQCHHIGVVFLSVLATCFHPRFSVLQYGQRPLCSPPRSHNTAPASLASERAGSFSLALRPTAASHPSWHCFLQRALPSLVPFGQWPHARRLDPTIQGPRLCPLRSAFSPSSFLPFVSPLLHLPLVSLRFLALSCLAVLISYPIAVGRL